ncbi:hypothetical protein GCM10023198_42970 [Promicromonospora umidemergens]|uniref:Uncharacterized protein n=1 Tax=Promicromonospora umidemergens TaxID=629679 RepID=A0ABP8XWW7_9MICO
MKLAPRIARAATRGRYWSRSIAASTCVRIRSLTPYALRITLETAARETPASRATSWIVDGRAGEDVLSGVGCAGVTALFPIL